MDDDNPYFMLDMTFSNANKVREAITKYSVAKGKDLRLKPNERTRIRATCKSKGCPFVILVSNDGKNGGMCVKTLNPQHTCYRTFNNSRATAGFLASHFKEKLYRNPKTSVKDLVDEAKAEMRITISTSKMKRAKRKVLTEMEGSFVGEFNQLEAYADQVKRTNPGSKCEIELDKDKLKEGKRVFKRMFICFSALKQGWKEGCRPLIGLDGSFLKGKVKGEVLVAVGKDASNQIFPIAWAVTDKENKLNWKWFLQWLVKDLDIQDNGKALTIISDMQKGLLQAVIDVLPEAEHRWCARHIYSNWSKKWTGGEMKKKFFICAWSTFPEEFEDNLKKLGEVNKQAAEEVLKYNPANWCRAFFSSRCKSDVVDNNMCETFNSTILQARFKPIISMLDDIRKSALERLAVNKAAVEKWIGDWSPECMVIFQENSEVACGCNVLFNGASGYEISDGPDRHTVFLDKKLCTCRAWDLTGIPCSHAICAMRHARVEPMSQISMWYHKLMYEASYKHPMQPMPGKIFMKCDQFLPIEPPPVTKMPGRPKTKRVRSENEPQKKTNAYKLSRKGSKISCAICHKEGHNKKSCTQSSTNVPRTENKGAAPSTKGQPAQASEQISAPPATSVSGSASSVKGKKKMTKTNVGSNRGRMFKSRNVGHGCYIDETSGSLTYNPGLATERIIIGSAPTISSAPVLRNPDPEIRFPIPCERELRRSRMMCRTSNNEGTRKIGFNGDGAEVSQPRNLPFKPPGLQWQGSACITNRQLEQQRQEQIGKLQARFKDAQLP